MTLKNHLRLAALLAAFASLPASAQQPKHELVKIQAFSLEKTQALGRAMYIEDQAAWQATDLLLAAKTETKGLIGWVAAPFAGGIRVRYLKGDPAAPTAAYDVAFTRGEKARFVPATNPELTPEEALQFRALQTAMSVSTPRCSEKPPNHIELRDPDTGEWLVWFLTPWTDAGVPAGGHVRVTVSADSTRVLREEQMSASCLTIPIDRKRPKTAMLMVSQLMADTPLETQVFNALQTKIPMGVIANDGTVWSVDGQTITQIGKVDAAK